jgi:hypothetical protein
MCLSNLDLKLLMVSRARWSGVQRKHKVSFFSLSYDTSSKIHSFSCVHVTSHSTIITHHNPTPADCRRRPPSLPRHHESPPAAAALSMRSLRPAPPPPPHHCRSPSSTATKRNQSTTIVIIVVAAAATRCRRHRPPHVDQGFLSVSPKKVPIADISDTAVALAVGDDRRRGGRGDGGERGGGDLCRRC